MGQRSQHYVQFCLDTKNDFTGVRDKGLSAFHLQWCYGWYMVERVYNLLRYIKKNIENYKDDEYGKTFTGGRFKQAREIRHEIYNLTEFNFECATCQHGIDLVQEKLDFQYADNHRNEKGERVYYDGDFRAFLNGFKSEKPTEQDLTYQINPYEQDNNDGITVIKVEEDGTIKYAFDLLDTWETHEFRPITAKDYYKVYRKYDSEHFTDKDKRMVRNKIKYIDENFTLLTADEMKEIFNQEYKW